VPFLSFLRFVFRSLTLDNASRHEGQAVAVRRVATLLEHFVKVVSANGMDERELFLNR
jgi:hypothetical protein